MKENCPGDIELQAFYDGQLPGGDAARVWMHVGGCEACGQKLDEMAALSRVFGDARGPVLVPIARMRLHRAVDGAMESGLLRIAWALSSVAACILVAGSAWMIHVKGAPATAAPRVVVSAPPWVAVPTTADADFLVHEQTSPVAQWYLADAGRRGDELP